MNQFFNKRKSHSSIGEKRIQKNASANTLLKSNAKELGSLLHPSEKVKRNYKGSGRIIDQFVPNDNRCSLYQFSFKGLPTQVKSTNFKNMYEQSMTSWLLNLKKSKETLSPKFEDKSKNASSNERLTLFKSRLKANKEQL